jgi:hypothetical protein
MASKPWLGFEKRDILSCAKGFRRAHAGNTGTDHGDLLAHGRARFKWHQTSFPCLFLF